MILKDKLYYKIVEKYPDIKIPYTNYVNAHQQDHRHLRLRSWALLFSLYLQHYCYAFSSKSPSYNTDMKYPETNIEERIPVEDMILYLSKYDIISFDIFDTLVFRAVSNPQDLFAIIGNELGIMNFKEMRIAAENEARKKCNNLAKEININEIYSQLQMKCGLDIETGITTELNFEKNICFANPYMKEVYNGLIQKGKRVIAVSNMYLTRDMIMQILQECGYQNLSEVFVSCEYRCSKRNGELQKVVKQSLGNNMKIIHVGDNYQADFVGSRKAGWKSYFYKNVNEIGKPYRPSNMSSIVGSIYSGLVNTKLHNGLLKTDSYYEFGYVYGGILTCAFCEWLNKIAQLKNIDKFLFSGRDMYIVHKIYNRYYKKIPNDYIFISRYASQRFSFERFSDYFINVHILARAHLKSLTISDAFEEVGLQCISPYLEEHNLGAHTILTPENFHEVSEYIYKYKEIILKNLSKEQKAAIAYYAPMVKNYRKIGIVDLGWQGTNAMCLKYLLEEKMDYDLKAYSLLLGAAGREFVDHLMTGGITESFCFAPTLNFDLYQQHRKGGELRRLGAEILFTSPDESLKCFDFENDEAHPIFMPKEQRNAQIIDSILKGINDYADDYHRLGLSDRINISGFEAYLPLNKLLYNQNYVSELFSGFEANPWMGIIKDDRGVDFARIIGKKDNA